MFVVYTTTKPCDHSLRYPIVSIKAPSFVLCDSVEKVKKDRVGGFIKRLADSEMDRVANGVRSVFDLAPSVILEKALELEATKEDQEANPAEEVPRFEMVDSEATVLNEMKIALAKMEAERDTYKSLCTDLLKAAFQR